MRIVAHRGLNRQALENTLPAFEAALASTEGVELDVQLAKCGTLVVFHDDTLGRIFGVPGTVADYSADELAQLVPRVSEDYAGPHSGWVPSADERIPTLGRVLDLLGPDFFVNVEIKASRVMLRTPTAAVAELLNGRRGDYLVSSFNPIELVRFSRLSTLPIAFLYDPESNLVLRSGWPAPALKLAGLRAIHPNYKLVSIDLVERAHARGWSVNVWTVNDPYDVAWMRRAGVDAVISDVADELLVAR